MAKFVCQFEDTDDALVIHLSGDLDEDAILTETTKFTDRKVILDLGQVTSINSMGLRHFSFWIKNLSKNVAPLTFLIRNAPDFIIGLVSIFKGLLPANGVVDSFYIPFCCEKCERTEKRLIQSHRDFYEFEKNYKDSIKVPRVNCPKCGDEMVLDVMPEKFFVFLRKKRKN